MSSIAQLDPDSAELKKRIERFQKGRDAILAQVRQVIVGQEEVLDQILISLFVGGDCLITGLPRTSLKPTAPADYPTPCLPCLPHPLTASLMASRFARTQINAA